MGKVFAFPSKKPVDDGPVSSAWESYRSLAQASIDRPELMVDPDHSQAVVRAWARWRDLFLSGDAA
jgi:hypothetical protein